MLTAQIIILINYVIIRKKWHLLYDTTLIKIKKRKKKTITNYPSDQECLIPLCMKDLHFMSLERHLNAEICRCRSHPFHQIAGETYNYSSRTIKQMWLPSQNKEEPFWEAVWLESMKLKRKKHLYTYIKQQRLYIYREKILRREKGRGSCVQHRGARTQWKTLIFLYSRMQFIFCCTGWGTFP